MTRFELFIIYWFDNGYVYYTDYEKYKLGVGPLFHICPLLTAARRLISYTHEQIIFLSDKIVFTAMVESNNKEVKTLLGLSEGEEEEKSDSTADTLDEENRLLGYRYYTQELSKDRMQPMGHID